jgi:hypothetical protein
MGKHETSYARREVALQYAGRGWPVLPCKDKAPLVRGGIHAATRDRSIVERWWRTWPHAEIGIACGAASGIVVIDIDTPAAVPALLDLPTLSASTPNGGRHLYCRYAEGIRNRVFAWGELRASGLYVIAPPGPGREWINEDVIAEAPEWLRELVLAPKADAGFSLERGASPEQQTASGTRRCAALGRFLRSLNGPKLTTALLRCSGPLAALVRSACPKLSVNKL